MFDTHGTAQAQSNQKSQERKDVKNVPMKKMVRKQTPIIYDSETLLQ
jgi:hypothetical protein